MQLGLGPPEKQVDVPRVVHEVHRARAGRAGGDFPKHGFAVGLEVPLHVGEAGVVAQHREHLFTHGAAADQLGVIDVFVGERLRRDPLVGPGNEGARAIEANVEVLDVTAGADGIEGVLLTIDEFLHIHHRNVAQLRDGMAHRRSVVAPKGVHRPRAGDWLDNERIAHLLCRRPDLGRCARHRVMRHTHAAFGERLLHEVLVAKPEGLLV